MHLLKIYRHALWGAVAGLFGWMLFGELLSSTWPWWQIALLGGAIIGAVMGMIISSTEAMADRSLARWLRYASTGIVTGAIGGAVGFWLGDWINYFLVSALGFKLKLAEVISRALGWTIFGIAVGIGEGIAERSRKKLLYGVIGGGIGGGLGGAVFALFISGAQVESEYAIGQAIGLILLGLFIGILRSLVEVVMMPSQLTILRGFNEGRSIPLLKDKTMLGRDEAADVLLLKDMAIQKSHALVEKSREGFLLRRLDGAANQLLINNAPLFESQILKDGDRITVGSMLLKFRGSGKRV